MSFTHRHSTAESAIRAELDQWLGAVRARDLPAIMRHYAPQIRAFDAIAQLQFQGLEAYTRHWQTCLEFCPGEFLMRLQDIEIHAGEDLAFVSALCHCGVVEPGGNEKSGWMRMSAGYLQLDNEWKVVHEHFSLPFDPLSNKVLDGLQP